MSEPLLVVKDLTVELSGVVVLDRVNLELNEGEFVTVVGPNGGGKTTLLKTIIGFIKPRSGEVILRDDLRKLPRGRIFGYLPQIMQEKSMFPLKAIDVVLFARYPELGPFSLPSKRDIEDAEKYLNYMGVLDLAYRKYNDLSGGQKQRVHLARVLMNKPKILLLDEPRTGIDIVGQENFYKLLLELKKENIGIIMVSHDIGTVTEYCDRVYCLFVRIVCHNEPKGKGAEFIECLYGKNMRGLTHEHGVEE